MYILISYDFINDNIECITQDKNKDNLIKLMKKTAENYSECKNYVDERNLSKIKKGICLINKKNKIIIYSISSYGFFKKTYTYNRIKGYYITNFILNNIEIFDEKINIKKKLNNNVLNSINGFNIKQLKKTNTIKPQKKKTMMEELLQNIKFQKRIDALQNVEDN